MAGGWRRLGVFWLTVLSLMAMSGNFWDMTQ